LILFVLWFYFLAWVLALWTWLSKLVKLNRDDISWLFLKFWIGLGALLILVSVLVWFRLFFPVITWLIFLWLWFMIWYMREEMSEHVNLISNILSSLNVNKWKFNWTKIILIALFVFSIIYYFYWFQLSFIPYSTAWDANHAYMYGPKVIAENHGLLWWNMWEASAMPYLWYMFITFWFSIGSVFSWGRLSPDTIAVAMNYLTGPLCLIFGLGLINEVLNYFAEKKNISQTAKDTSLILGRSTLLMWLTSWMWAFLVFVDNKTDLWVMAITLLAILSWFIMIRSLWDFTKIDKFNKKELRYLIISWVLFALAGMAKPSAFIDMVVFWLILVALLIDGLLSLWLWVIAVGMMWILQPVNAADFMTPDIWVKLVILWLIVCAISIVIMIVKHKKEIMNKKNWLYYIVVWWLSLFATLLVFKWPWLAYKQISNHEFGIIEFGKWLFLSYDNSGEKAESDNKLLLAATEDYQEIVEQNIIDDEYLQADNNTDESSEEEVIDTTTTNNISIDACLRKNYTEKELKEWMEEAEVTNEDVWRYVWYWWKEFGHNKNRLSFAILKIFYHKNWKCYGFNKDGVTLCENQKDIQAGDIDKLTKLKESWVLKKWKAAETLLDEWLESYKENKDTLMDLVSNLTTYYQNNSIYVENWIINIPYRYIVPFNIVFNWSLQNLSSYYTDIGFIWMFVFIVLILWLIYSIFNVKSNNKLYALAMPTIIGWAIWWIIWWWILWYGIWLLMWTILVLSTFIQDLLYEDNDSTNHTLFMIFCILLWFWMIIQMFFNLIRISSQWSSGPFLWFKQSAWEEQIIDEQLSVKTNQKYFYSQKDVFNLQFPHYNKFIEYVKDRADEDGVLIAGTYIQYFLDNQRNLNLDGSLTWFWEQWSDEDSCKMYHRLRNNNIKYLVIDPNIASIVMWEWNKSLLYRFFAKFNEDGKMIKRWAMVMLTQLIEDWYMNFLYSNNLWAKYAFTLSDEELMEVAGQMDADELTYFKAQLSSARYMDNANELINYIAQILWQRLLDWKAIWDIADIYGKIIDEEKVLNAVNVWIQSPNSLPQIVSTLNQDERYILYNYLNMYIWIQQSNDTYNNVINTLLSSSIAWGSQLMVFELK